MFKREKVQKLFGEVVRKERKRQKITQSELAERSELDYTYISQIERGLANPSIYSLHKISDSLGLSEKEMFQKMNKELNLGSASKVNAAEELEIIHDAIVKLDAGILLTSTHDDDFRIIYCNKAFLEFSGLEMESIIGKKLMDILANEKNNDKLLQFFDQLKVESPNRMYIGDTGTKGESLQLEINSSLVIGDGKQSEKHLFILRKDFYKEQLESDLEVSETVNKYKALVSESNHRIKNNLAIIAGIMDINILDVEDEVAKSILQDTQLRISSIAHIHDLLTASEDPSRLGIRDYLKKLTTVIANTYELKKGIKIETTIGVDDLGINEIIALGLLFNELITNSYKYAFKDYSKGKIKLSLNHDKNEEISFLYTDNGSGFDQSIFDKADTLGMNLIHTFLNQLEAKDIKVDTNDGFKLEFVIES